MNKKNFGISKSDLLDFVEIESSFAFEMKVRELFASRRLRYLHGGTYEDPHTGLPRQFDLRVDLNCSLPKVRTRVLLAIECKALSEFAPMLVYRSPRTAYEAGHQLIAQTCGDREKIIGLLNHHMRTPLWNDRVGEFPSICTLDIAANRSRYRSGDFVGKSVDVVSRDGSGSKFKSGDAEVYGRWTQALQSAASLLGKLDGQYSGDQKIEFTWIVPILVVPDRRLFVVDYDDSAVRVCDPNEIDRTPFYIDYKPPTFKCDGPPFKFGHFEIMTYAGLRDFVENITSDDSRHYLDLQIGERACFEALSRF
jgi:hypothetical protein